MAICPAKPPTLHATYSEVPFLTLPCSTLCVQAKEEELKQKRELLLEKNHTLDTLASTPQTPTVDTLQLDTTEPNEPGEEQLEGISQADVIDDIMLLNEEVEVLDGHVTVVRKQLKTISEIAGHAQYEDIGERDEYEVAAQLALELTSKYQHFKSLEAKLHELVASLEALRKEHDFSDAPLQYMLQLPPRPAGRKGEEQGEWLHTLPDHLTGKTNCEMRVEVCLLKEMIKYAEELQQR